MLDAIYNDGRIEKLYENMECFKDELKKFKDLLDSGVITQEEFDAKKKQLLATFIICIAFVFMFWIDLFKYDDYIPDAENVKIVKLDSNLFGEINSKWEDERDWLQGDLLKDAIAVVREMKDGMISSDDESYYKENNFYNIKITYIMKSGREVKRDYSFDVSKASENLNKLYANEDVKDDYCVLYNIDKEDVQGISVNNGINGMDLELPKEELNQFIDIYLEEYSRLQLKDALSDIKQYEINVSFQLENMKHPSAERYYVYSSFTKSIAFLKEKGVKSFQESEDVRITNMEIFGNKYEDTHMYVSDLKQLKELKPYLTDKQYNDYARYLSDFQQYIIDQTKTKSRPRSTELSQFYNPQVVGKSRHLITRQLREAATHPTTPAAELARVVRKMQSRKELLADIRPHTHFIAVINKTFNTHIKHDTFSKYFRN